MDKKIQSILSDLYKIEPKLKESEKKLIQIIEALLEAKPDTKFDQAFAQNLKTKLIQNKPTTKSFNFGFMRKITYVISGMAGAFVLVFAGYFAMQNGFISGISSKESKMLAFEPNIVEVGENAFGNLVNEQESTGLGGNRTTQETASQSPQPVESEDSAHPATAKIISSSDNAVAESTGAESSSSETQFSEIKTSSSTVTGPAFMPPYQPTIYKYTYEGDDFSSLLKDEKVDVLRKAKGNLEKNAVLDFINNFDFGLVNISKFSDLYLQNISVAEDHEFGYTIFADFENGNISINQNWLKWPQCDQQCWNTRKSLTLEDLPEDSTVIKATDAFLQEYGIDTSVFGKPVINKYWLRDMASAKLYGYEPYVPESISVTYPLMINSQEVYYDSGTITGMDVSYDIRLSKVTGLYNLSGNDFESSKYEAVTSKDDIMKWIEKGGWQSYPIAYEQVEGSKPVEIKVGSPKLGYMKYWNYRANENNELLIPALIFPITQKPEEDVYFYKDSLMIPLAKEFLEQTPEPFYGIMESVPPTKIQ